MKSSLRLLVAFGACPFAHAIDIVASGAKGAG